MTYKEAEKEYNKIINTYGSLQTLREEAMISDLANIDYMLAVSLRKQLNNTFKQESYSKCTCSSIKWKTRLSENYIQCLNCYKKYTVSQFKKLGKS